jgi:RNA-directed DNA polymerase
MSSRVGPSPTSLAPAIAAAFLAGTWTEDAMVRRAREAVEPAPRWLRRVAAAVVAAYHQPPDDRPRELTEFVRLTIAALRVPPPPQPRRVRRWFLPEQRMVRRRWPVVELDTKTELAALLELDASRLDWLADIRGLERTVESEQLRNYRYAWLPRTAAPPRVLEQPKSMLKAAQRRVLREVLDWIPAHEAAHGFVPGRSARSHAAAHAGAAVVLRLDLEDYFASVTAGRVYGIFRTAGYPEAVAHALTALCTNVVPRAEWAALPRPDEPLRTGASAAGSPPRTCRRARPPPPHSPASPPSRSTGASRGWPRRSAPASPATPTTSPSPETPRSPVEPAGSPPSPARSPGTRASS